MSEKVKHKLKGWLIVGAFPVGMAVAAELICLAATGSHMIISSVDLSSFVKNVFILTLSGIALSLGMASGRMDFSLGAQRLVACLIGCNIALRLDLGGIWVLLFAIIFGMLAGVVSGLIFIAFRIPSMVSGLGVALIFESVTFIFSDGEGLHFFGNAGLNILSSTAFVTVFCLVVIVIVTVIYSYTSFGYHYQAIRGNQKIAFNSGIKVFGNVIICYIIGGSLMGISGVLDTVYKGSMSSVTGMASVSVAFYSIVGVIIAMSYAKYVSLPIAVFTVTIGLQCMSSAITALRINASGANAIQMLFLLGFAFVTYQLEQRHHRRLVSERIREAQKLWAQK